MNISIVIEIETLHNFLWNTNSYQKRQFYWEIGIIHKLFRITWKIPWFLSIVLSCVYGNLETALQDGILGHFSQN